MQPAASPEDGKPFRAPHPLAVALIQRLLTKTQGASGGAEWVLDFACGSGRNSAALAKAGLSVAQIDDVTASSRSPFDRVTGPFAAVISTHGLLHGSAASIAANAAEIARLLAPGGVLYATFGSIRDARFGIGERLDDATYAPLYGDEAGVAHTFFDRDRLTALLEKHFTIESLEERTVDEVAGAWAHRDRPLSGALHWFVVARV